LLPYLGVNNMKTTKVSVCLCIFVCTSVGGGSRRRGMRKEKNLRNGETVEYGSPEQKIFWCLRERAG
jgi:hypothetical protein